MGAKDVCNKIAIYGEKNEPLIFSTNINIDGNRIILLGQGFSLVSHQTVVEAIGYSNNGIIPIQGKVTLSTETQLNLEALHVGEKQERRNYLKVKTGIEATILRARALGKSKKSFTLNALIELRDISVGGVCFFCNSRLFKGQRIVLDLDQVKEGLVLEALILRTIKERGKIGFRFRYGCQFTEIGNEEERILCEYVFKKEIEAHRRQKDLELD